MKAFFARPLSQVFLSCLSISVLWWLTGWWYFAAAAAAIFLFSALSSTFRDAFLHYFQLFMSWIGKVKSAILLGVIFYAVLVPIALISRVFSGKKEEANTNWQQRNHQVGPADFEKMW